MYMLFQQGQHLVPHAVARNLQAPVGLVGSIGLSAGIENIQELRPGPTQQRPHQLNDVFRAAQRPAGGNPGQPGNACTPAKTQQEGLLLIIPVMTRRDAVQLVPVRPVPVDRVAKLPRLALAQRRGRLVPSCPLETNTEKLCPQLPCQLPGKNLILIGVRPAQRVVHMAEIELRRTLPESCEMLGQQGREGCRISASGAGHQNPPGPIEKLPLRAIPGETPRVIHACIPVHAGIESCMAPNQLEPGTLWASLQALFTEHLDGPGFADEIDATALRTPAAKICRIIRNEIEAGDIEAEGLFARD